MSRAPRGARGWLATTPVDQPSRTAKPTIALRRSRGDLEKLSRSKTASTRVHVVGLGLVAGMTELRESFIRFGRFVGLELRRSSCCSGEVAEQELHDSRA